MASGRCNKLVELPHEALEILNTARRGVLATVGEDGTPHAVPVGFAVVGDRIISPVDDKPKGGAELVRVKNVRSRRRATFLVDRWSEDWDRLGWVMVRGDAVIEVQDAVTQMLLERYPQYRHKDLSPGSRAIALSPETVSWWLWSS